MWHLDKPSQQTLDAYANTLLYWLIKRIEKSTDLPQYVKDLLVKKNVDGSRNDTVLRRLLTNEPYELFELSESLMRQIITGYNSEELSDVSKAKKSQQPDDAQQALIKKYELLKKLEDSFGYNAAISQNKNRSYKITAAGNHNTCVYCNRQYTINIERNGGTNDDNRIVRPALDHWFPKSLFPLMSLSYYNLIPCCTVCNSQVKKDEIWGLTTHVHPYLTMPDEPKFKFRYKAGVDSTWDIDFDGLADKEERTAKSLCLQEVYQAHSSMEIADLIEFATKNNGTYMKQLFGTILKLYTSGVGKTKAYRLLIGTEMMSDAYKNRPMSKLKKDLIEQIEKAQGIRFFE